MELVNVLGIVGIFVIQLFGLNAGFPIIEGCQPKIQSGFALYGFNDRVLKDVAVETCFKECMIEVSFDCKSFDYNPGKRICYLSASSVDLEPSHFGVHGNNDYYDIECGLAGTTTPSTSSGESSGYYSGGSGVYSGQGSGDEEVEDCSRKTLEGKEYRGKVSKTVNGRTCQRWDTQYPHKHTRNEMFWDGPYVNENYCRNPDSEPGGPWCYTTDSKVRWEYCDVKVCSEDCDWYGMCAGRSECKDKTCYSQPTARCAPSFCQGCKGDWFDGGNKIDCESTKRLMYTTNCKNTVLGGEYIGRKTYTESGRACQRWDSQYPHEHSRGAMFKDGASVNENFCRNPDNEPNGPWCYTTDSSKRWEYCGIQECSHYNESMRNCDHYDLKGITDLSLDNYNWVAGRWMNIFVDFQIEMKGAIESYKLHACATGAVYIDVWRPNGDWLNLVGSNLLFVDQKGTGVFPINPENQINTEQGDVIGIHYPDDGGNDAIGGVVCYEDSRFYSLDYSNSPKSRFVNLPNYENEQFEETVRNSLVPGITRSFALHASITCGSQGVESCPKGWDDNGNSCYTFVVGNDKTPEGAADYCREQHSDAHLVSIDDYDEFTYVTKNIKVAIDQAKYYSMASRELWWTSGTKDSEGNWYWHNHKYDDAQDSPLEWAIWYPGEPNDDGGNENYINLLLLYGQWGLNDISKNNRLRFICELDKF